jgi:iron(II)-dependent oxidoreductase
MPSDSTVLSAGSAKRGWFFRSAREERPHAPEPAASSRQAAERRLADSSGLLPDLTASDVRGLARRLVAEERFAFVLLKEAAEVIGEQEARAAWKALREQMALVPHGVVPVVRCNGVIEAAEISAFYLDRHDVTNQQFQRFVQAGGYDALEIWPREVWPSLMKFTDRTGKPGPLGWEHSRFPSGKADHPVVGICWFEALAFAQWAGKRLPTATEWQKAGGWPEQLSGGNCNRYPWGDVFDPKRANLWSSGQGQTVSVSTFPSGSTPNGIYQMTGNVWKWLEDPLDSIPCRGDETFHPWKPMRRIIGGAYDTYMVNEATCHFVTGQAELDRRHNIGFRCAISADRLRDSI